MNVVPYVSALAVEIATLAPASSHTEIEGSWAFFDLSGFTRLSERLAGLGAVGAELLKETLNTVFHELIEEARIVGGDVVKFGGDAFLVVFRGEGHADRAAHAAASMQRLMRARPAVRTPLGPVRLRMSSGIESGSARCHLVGTSRVELALTGPVISAVAGLEASAEPGETLVGPTFAAEVADGWLDMGYLGTRPGASRLMRRRRGGAAASRDPSAAPPTPGSATIELLQLLPREVRDHVGRSAEAGEHKLVVIGFVAIDDLDDLLDEAGADAVHERVAAVSRSIDAACSVNGVCWLETDIGAGQAKWLLVAGSTVSGEHDTLAMLTTARSLVSGPDGHLLRIGVNRGRAFVADIGHSDRRTFNVMGDAVNLAARLMSRAAPGTVLSTTGTVDASGSDVAVHPVGTLTVKGRRGSVDAVEVGDLSAPPVGTLFDELPFVGRAAERDLVIGSLLPGAVIHIIGEAGLGKSRLVHEVRRDTPELTWSVIRGEPHRGHLAYGAVAPVMRDLVGIDRELPPRDAGTALWEALPPAQRPWAPLIADVLGAELPPTPEVGRIRPDHRRDKAISVLAELLSSAAPDQPARALFVEDAHWLDESSAQVVAMLQRNGGPLGLSFVVTSRSSDVGGVAPTAVVALQPLPPHEAERLLHAAIGDRAFSDAALASMQHRSDGNPLFLRELARSGATGRDLPETVEQVLAARIDVRPVDERRLIRELSVLGNTIDPHLAALVLERQDLEGPGGWRAISAFVVPAGDRMRFQHDLVRVAAYEGLSFRRRRHLHERVAVLLEETAAPTPDPGETAWHWSRADRPDRTWLWARRAAEAATAKGAMGDAAQFLRDALDAGRRLDVDAAELAATHVALAEALEPVGELDDALAQLSRVDRLVPTDLVTRAKVAHQRAHLLEFAGRYRDALGATTRGERLANEAGDEAAVVRLLLMRANLWACQGRFREARRLVDALGPRIERIGDVRLAAQAHLLMGIARDGDDDRDHEEQALTLLRQLDDPVGLGNLLLNRGFSQFLANRWPDADASWTESAVQYGRAGDVVGGALTDVARAEMLTYQHRLEEAERLLHRSRRILRSAGYPLGVALTASGLSRIELYRGRPGPARELLDEAMTVFEQLGAEDYVLDTRLRIAEWELLAGSPAAALVILDDTSPAISRIGDPGILPVTEARLRGFVLLAADRAADARRAFRRAHTIASRDSFEFEMAMADLGLSACGDEFEHHRVGAEALLRHLGVKAPPPTTGPITPPGRSPG